MTLPDLLARAGYVLFPRARRATCPLCSGRDRMTVGYSERVGTYHCFRCGDKGNTKTLRKKLGLATPQASMNPKERAAARRREHAEKFIRSMCAAFDGWVARQERAAREEYRVRGQRAAVARAILAVDPESPVAWDSLAAFYHAEARLTARLELLTGAKCPLYAARTETAALFEEWRAA